MYGLTKGWEILIGICYFFRKRLTDTFFQNWNERSHTSTRARSYTLFCDFSYKTYLEVLKIEKY